MTKKEANLIIENYKSHKNFYDLSERPATLTKVEYIKLLKIQVYLAWQEGNKAYLMKMLPLQWMEDKELSANYQSIVSEYWDINKV